MPTEKSSSRRIKVAAAMNGKPVIIRTLDIGGDKEIRTWAWRRTRISFWCHRAICSAWTAGGCKPQLRALLRASAFGNIRIMVPLVTCIEEYRQAKAWRNQEELDENIAYNKDIQWALWWEMAAS